MAVGLARARPRRPVVATIWWEGSGGRSAPLLVDLAFGPAIACLLGALATGHPAALVRVLDARPLRSLGASSYSLYLTHAPIVVIVYERLVAGRVAQGVPAFVVTLAVALPLTIVFARLFASVFEKPFRGPRRRRPAAPRRLYLRLGRVPA